MNLLKRISIVLFAATVIFSGTSQLSAEEKIGVLFVDHGGMEYYSVQNSFDAVFMMFLLRADFSAVQYVFWNPYFWKSLLDLSEDGLKQDIKNDEDKKVITTKTEKSKEEHEIQNQNSNKIVHIKENIPEFIGTDTKKYNLRKNDVITLPEDMSKMLSKKGAAEEVKE